MPSPSQPTASPFAHCIEAVARELLGEPNPTLSSRDELRWGSNGSVSLDLVKLVYFDHETNKGGGTLPLVMHRTGADKPRALEWLAERRHIEPTRKAGRRPVAVYAYKDEEGRRLFDVVRFEPKGFAQRKPDGPWTMQGVRRVVYHLPELLAAIAAGRVIFVAEGEKGVHAIETLDLPATCSPGGAGKWTSEYSKSLTGADVVILPDNDEPGRDHAKQVANALEGHARRIRVLPLPGLPDKGDVADWIAAGGTASELMALAAEAATPAEVAPAETAKVVRLDIERAKKILEVLVTAPQPAETAKTATRSMSWDWTEADLAPRPWVVPGFAMRGHVTVLGGAGGSAKSALTLAQSVAFALGRKFGKYDPQERRRVLIYNVEDGENEQPLRVAAALRQFGAHPREMDGWLEIRWPEGVGTLIGYDGIASRLTQTAAMDELEKRIEDTHPDIVILDPLVELHNADENSNVQMRAIVAHLRALATRYKCAIIVVHHFKKGATTPGDPDSLRGAGGIIGAGRVALTLNPMTEDEANACGIKPDERRHFVRLDNAKLNYSASGGAADWFELRAYPLANGEFVAATVPWAPPVDAITLDTLHAVEAAVAKGFGPQGTPYSAQLTMQTDRSILHLLIAHGIITREGQQAAVKRLIEAGFTIEQFFEPQSRTYPKGLRAPNGTPEAKWETPAEPTQNPR